ncbi:zinc-ribbon domain containing protein [Candidatus Falkowbacteria bacterium]|nr:zinc-ribbon domain containing protein [Candidatus Falkowbacteria bacterium]
MPDIQLTCRDCGKPFTFTERDQAFYQEKGWENQPTRCRDCARAKRQNMQGPRQMYPAVCAVCGKDTEVPFQPKGDRPVKCLDCFRADKAAA